jgi:hypothetical protein
MAVGLRVLVSKIHSVDAGVRTGHNGKGALVSGANLISRGSEGRWLVEARTWSLEQNALGVGRGKGRDGRVSHRPTVLRKVISMTSGEGYKSWELGCQQAAGPGRPGVWSSGAEVGPGVRGLGTGPIVRGWDGSSIGQIVHQRYGMGGLRATKGGSGLEERGRAAAPMAEAPKLVALWLRASWYAVCRVGVLSLATCLRRPSLGM